MQRVYDHIEQIEPKKMKEPRVELGSKRRANEMSLDL